MIYRIPTRQQYKKKRVDTGKSWDDIYGKAICNVCNEHFKETDMYTRNGKGFRHVECEPEKKEGKCPLDKMNATS